MQGRHSQATLRGILGKNKDQLLKTLSEKFPLDIVTGKNGFLLRGISMNLIYLPIHNLFITDYRYQGRLKNQTILGKNPAFLHTLLPPPTRYCASQCPYPSPFSAPLLRQWSVWDTGTSAHGAGSFTGSSFSRMHLSAPAPAEPWTQLLPRYPLPSPLFPLPSSLLLLHCGFLLKSVQTKKSSK